MEMTSYTAIVEQIYLIGGNGNDLIYIDANE